MHTNKTTPFPTPPSPSCTLVPQASLIPALSDNVLAILLPTIVYAIVGGFFHLLDIYNLFHDYRIHPSEDVLKRNHVTKWQCLRTVMRYHIIQISIGLALNYGTGPAMVGCESYQVHRAAGMIRRARHIIPSALNAMGIDANRLALATESTSAGLAQVLAGDELTGGKASPHTGLNTVELSLAKLLLFFGVPAFQYLVALMVVDTWIYFTHRLCHVNKTLYRKSLYVYSQAYHLHVKFIHSHRYRPRPTPPALRLIRVRRRIRSLARDGIRRRTQLRSRGRDSAAIGATEHALWLIRHDQNPQRSLRLCIPLGSFPPRQQQRG